MFWKAQAAIANDDVLARDLCVNTFHYETTTSLTPFDQAADLATQLIAFYHVIDDQLSPNVLSTAGLTIKVWNMEDAPPRVPVYTTIQNLTPSTTQPMPPENAVCISYKAAPASGANPRRNRGRIYIGPLTTAAINSATTVPTVATAVQTEFANAAFDLMTFTGATSGASFAWSVFSKSDALGLPVGTPPPPTEPTYTPTELADGYHQIATVYVDNAFDTQRRRGLLANSRVVGS